MKFRSVKVPISVQKIQVAQQVLLAILLYFLVLVWVIPAVAAPKMAQKSGLRILEEAPGYIVVEYTIPDFHIDTVPVGGQPASQINLPGHILIQEKDCPELPLLSTSLIVPGQGRVELQILQHDVYEMPVAPVIPSLGHLQRDVNPSDFDPRFGAVYTSGRTWPEDNTKLSKPYILRDFRGVNLSIYPLQYNPGTKSLVVTKRLVVAISTGGSGGVNELDVAESLQQQKNNNLIEVGPIVFNQIYNGIFDNYAHHITRTDKSDIDLQPARMLIVADDSLADELDSFVHWKQQLGISVEVVKVSQAGQTADNIKSAISERYYQDHGLTWVILVGDLEQVPSNVGAEDGTDSDSMYAMLAGDDLYPEIFVSRISAQNTTQLHIQLNKIINYERRPTTGSNAQWYSRALGIASDEGSPPDFLRMNDLRRELLSSDFSEVGRSYQSLGGSTASITAALENGCSLINYLGHGIGTAWTSVSYDIDDISGVQNGDRLPWIIDASCSNGDFSLDECFAEAWMRAGTANSPAGAVAMLASSSISPWTPPAVMQAEVSRLLAQHQENTIGSLCYGGLVEALDQYSGLSVGRLVMEQNIIFGDCSMMVRTREPLGFALGEVADLDSLATEITISISGAVGAVVTLTSNGVLNGYGRVDASGQAVVEIRQPLAGQKTVLMTVTGFNRIPAFKEINIIQSEEPEPEPEPLPVQNIQLVGNYPNPFNPVTQIAFELPAEMPVQLSVYNVKGRLVKLLANNIMAQGRQEISWDGRDNNGREQASGIYLYRLGTPEGDFVGRMVLTR